MAACDLVYTERAENAPSASPELHGQQQCWCRGEAAHGTGMCVGWAQTAGPVPLPQQLQCQEGFWGLESSGVVGGKKHRGVERSWLNLFCRGITQTLKMLCCQLGCCSRINHNLDLTSLSLHNKDLLLHWICLTVCFLLEAFMLLLLPFDILECLTIEQ